MQELIDRIKDFYSSEKRMPSYSEIAKLFGFASKNAAFKLVNKLIDAGVLEKDGTGRIRPAGGASLGLPLLGYVQAGFPNPAEETLIDTLSLDEFLIGNRAASFLLKVTGDSMIDAGIHPKDLVIIERGKDPKNGDIVLAEVDGAWTLKYFRKSGKKVELVPANKKYPVITPRSALSVAGVVQAVVRKY